MELPLDSKASVTVWWTPWREDGAKPAEAASFRYMTWPKELRFSGLLPDHRYAIWIDGTSMVAWIPDLLGAGGTRTLAVVASEAISGHVQFVDPSDAEGGAIAKVEERGFRRGVIVEKGAFTLTGLPPGRFTVRARAMSFDYGPDAKLPPEATAAVSTGGTVDLVVPARTRGVERK